MGGVVQEFMKRLVANVAPKMYVITTPIHQRLSHLSPTQ